MIVEVQYLTIGKLAERQNDLLFSKDDIKTLAKNERAKALSKLWKEAIYKFDEVLSLEELSELIDEQLKEQSNE